MNVDEILKNATPRPWKHHDMESATIVANHIAVADFGAHSRPRVENEANCCFSILAVNAYEKQREVIRILYSEVARLLDYVPYADTEVREHGQSALAKAKELL